MHYTYWAQYELYDNMEYRGDDMSRTSSAVKDRYNAKAYDEIKVRVPKGQKELIQAFAEANGESINSFINRLIRAEMHAGEAKTEE